LTFGFVLDFDIRISDFAQGIHPIGAAIDLFVTYIRDITLGGDAQNILQNHIYQVDAHQPATLPAFEPPVFI